MSTEAINWCWKESLVYWGPLGSIRVYWGLLGSVGICWGLMGSSRIYRDIFRSTWIYWDLLGSTRDYFGLLRSTGIYWGTLEPIWFFWGLLRSPVHSVDFLPQNYASKSTFYRHLVELSYWCHLKGPCVGSFLGENSVPTFDFEGL